MQTRSLPSRFSRSTLAFVVAAHAGAAAFALTWSVQHRPTEPTPLMVTLMSAPVPELLPVPLPAAPEPVPRPEPPRDVAPRPIPKTTVAQPVAAPEPEQPEREPEPPIEPPPLEPPRPLADIPAPPLPVPPPAAVAALSPEAAPVLPVPEAAARPDPPTRLVAPAPPTAPAAAPAETEQAVQVWQADYLRNPKPEYPNSSRRLGEHGTVVLRVLVSPAGDASRVELKGTSGYHRLDDSALAAVRQWKFVPARRGEQPVAAWVVVPIRFTLKG